VAGKLPDILPPSDLLKQVDGIEAGLRKGKRIGGIGWVVIGALQFTVFVLNSQWLTALRDLRFDLVLQQLPVLLPTFTLGFVWLLYTWNAFWLKESEAPFRYTYWVDGFDALSSNTDARSGQLRYDLAERLSERIGRLTRANAKPEKKADPKKASATARKSSETAEPSTDSFQTSGESHIHVGGYYVIRDTPDATWQIEVTAWVGIGPPGCPETKAHLVTFPMRCPPSARPRAAKKPAAVKPCLKPEPLNALEYDQLVERVYFSVATQIYKQIRQDVQHKISLLPTDYFKATAYLHEAEDYARSNTLDAYDEARELYQAAMQHFEVSWQPMAQSRARRVWQIGVRIVSTARRAVVRWLAHMWPSVAKSEVLASQAETGYAKMVLYRRALAALSGRRMNPVFEARPIARQAVERLQGLARDVPSQPATLFDAYVTTALALGSLEDFESALIELENARQLLPGRAEQDARYLFVRGFIEPNLRTALLSFVRAVEVDPQFEVAQFQLAATWDKLWRRAPTSTFDTNLAEIVTREYAQVLKLNPGNVAAWDALGYVHWLQGGEQHEQQKEHLRQAEVYYLRGREYKQIKRETFVAELDQGLARIAAERGDAPKAYASYMDSITAFFAVGFSHLPRAASPRTGEFQFIGEAMIARFDAYRRQAEKALGGNTSASANGEASIDRVRDCLRAFVRNDYAEACYAHFVRVGDPRSWELARLMFESASALIAQHEIGYVMPDYNLHSMYLGRAAINTRPLAEWEVDRFKDQAVRGDHPLEQARRTIRAVREIEPDWIDGKLAYCAVHAEWVPQARSAVKKLKPILEECESALAYIHGPEAASSAMGVQVVAGLALAFGAEGERKSAGELMQMGSSPTRADAEAKRLEGKVRALTERIKDLERDIRVSTAEVTDLVRGLLPHAWLWSAGKGQDEPDLNWSRLDSPDRFKQFRWEKDLNDPQVEALFTWAMCECGRLDYLTSITGGSKVDDSSPQPTRRDLQRMGLEKSEKLLDHIERHFWPNDLRLLYKRRDLPLFAHCQAINRRIRHILQRDGLADPQAFVALTNLARDPAFDGHDSRRLRGLRAAASKPNLSAFVYQLIGDRLMEYYRVPSPAPTSDAVPAAPDNAPATNGAPAEPPANGQLPQNWWRWLPLVGGRGRVRQDQPSPAASDGQAAAFECLEAIMGAYEMSRAARDPTLFAACVEYEADLLAPRNQAHRELATALWEIGKYSLALDELDQIQTESGLSPGWLDQAVAEMLKLTASPGDRQLLLKSLASRARQCALRGDRAAASDARRAILRVLGGGQPASDAASESESGLARPIVLAADVSLFPDLRDTPEVHRMLGADIPVIQRQVYETRGVRMPGVLIQATNTPTRGAYSIHLHDVPRRSGRVMPGMLLCSDVIACARLGLTGQPGRDPIDGSDGVWLPEKDRAAAERANVPLLDVYHYMLADLRGVVESHLDSQLGLNELDHLLREWSAVASGSTTNGHDAELARPRLIRDALPDHGARLRLVRCLRNLVQEGISILDLETILIAFRDAPGGIREDSLALVEYMRTVLRPRVARAAERRERLRLAAPLESSVSTPAILAETLRGLTPTGPDSDRLLAAVREFVGTRDPRKMALVVAEPRVRPVVRRIVAREFPQLAVFSDRELPARPSWFDKEVAHGGA
jgi:hypothetical protein